MPSFNFRTNKTSTPFFHSMSFSSLIDKVSEFVTSCPLVSVVTYVSLVLGVFKLTTFLLSFFSLVYDILLAPPAKYGKYGAKKGKWAVVTGASDGLGKEYALQLAAKGLNVVLVSRTQSKLELLAADIESKYQVQTRVVAFDASSAKDADYEKVATAISDLPVTVLINNVGQSHSIPVPFLETPKKELGDIVEINNVFTLRVTQVVAPVIQQTVQKEGKKVRGLILTMSSFGGLLPTPYLATYSGSKAFLQAWSAALAGELKPQGIDVEVVFLYLVTSAMSKVRHTSLTIPNPKLFVRSALASVGRRVGAQERYATSTPYWAHALMHFGLVNTVGVYSKIANKFNLDMHKSIRARALKKAARIAAQKND